MEIWRETTRPVNATVFNSDQFSGAYPPGMEEYWWNHARNKIIANIFEKHLLRDQKILEVGCGSGIVTDYLRAREWNVLGVDLGVPNSTGQQRNYIVYGKDVKNLPLSTRKGIEVIGLFDVLEHIPEPTKFTSQLLKACPNTKLLVVTVPARQEIWTNFDEHYGHCRRYSLKQFDDEMVKAGLKKVWAGYFFHLLYLAILITKFVKRKRKEKFTPPKTFTSILIHKLFALLLKIEFRLGFNKIPGSSLIGVYSKNKNAAN